MRWDLSLFQVILTRLSRESYVDHPHLKTLLTFFEGLAVAEAPDLFLILNNFLLYKMIASDPHLHDLRNAIFITMNILTSHQMLKMSKKMHISPSLFKQQLQEIGIEPNPEKFTLSKWILSFLTKSWQVERNIPYYIDKDHKSNKFFLLDVYKSPSCPPNAPIMMYIHGGAWVTGDKSLHSLPLLYHISSKGWVVFSINYRLSPHVAFPSHLIDCKRALNWIRTIGAPRFNADPNFIVVAGESAGGHLSMLMALTQNVAKFQPGFEEANTSVDGCVDLYGVHDFIDEEGHFSNKDNGGFKTFIERIVMKTGKKKADHQDDGDIVHMSSPLRILRSLPSIHGVPPFLGFHGDRDSLVPIQDAVVFYQELKKRRAQENSDVKDAFCIVPGAHHGFNFVPSTRGLAADDTIYSFLRHIKNNKYPKSKL